MSPTPAARAAALWSEWHGSGEPTLLMLHGLGATAEVWRGVVAASSGRWPGRILLVDLPGHGRSPRYPAYTYEVHADALLRLLDGGPTVVVGHSMGGVIGLLLADWLTAGVTATIGLGIKSRWSPEDVQGMRQLAERPAREFDSRDEAAARYLRSTGLEGLVEPADPMVDSGLRRTEEGRWRLALDPPAFRVGAPDLRSYIAAARCPVTLARGSGDGMVSMRDLAVLHPEPRELPGLGHNAHVEDPAAVWRMIEGELARHGANPR